MRKMEETKQKNCRKIERCVLLITVIRNIIKHDKCVQTIISENIK
jgi:hypothetical protein